MIVFNGCSFVEQSHLETEANNWKDLYWPALISPEHVNLAQSGASNTRIWRTTLDHIYSNHPCKKLYIGWSGIEREELPAVNGDTVNLRPNNCFYNQMPETDTGNIKENWYKNHWNEWLALDRLVDYILTIQDACKCRGIKYWMWNSWTHNYLHNPLRIWNKSFFVQTHRWDRKQRADRDRLVNKINNINWKQWIWQPKDTLSNWAKVQGLDFETYGHPALSAQQPIADYILQQTRG